MGEKKGADFGGIVI